MDTASPSWRGTTRFAHNTSRVEAVGRGILALVLLVAMWLDPAVPVRSSALGYAMLALFLGWSGLLLMVALNSWWWDHRLAVPAHLMDLLLFTGTVYFTEAPNTDFTSPFMALAVLLLIKARLRWDWRATVLTAAALVVLNTAAVAGLSFAGFDINLQRFGRRAVYMVFISLLLVWLGLERRVALAGRLRPLSTLRGSDGTLRPLLTQALDFARGEAVAGAAALVWTAEQEPWIEIVSTDGGTVAYRRAGPDAGTGLAPNDGQPAPRGKLFDRLRHRALFISDTGQRLARHDFVAPPLLRELGVDEGVMVPFTCTSGAGTLVLWKLADPCFDTLALARVVAEEIGHAIDREALAGLAQASAVSSVREAIARDLHDSVAQFLAGTMFRLEALRRWIGSGHDPDPEIVAIKEAMRREQGQLRELIGRLRRGETGDRHADLASELTILLEEIGAHWQIEARLENRSGPDAMALPVPLVHDVRQLVREAVANAARHGKCRAVSVSVRAGADDASAADKLELVIRDDGDGFPEGETITRPRSISERVAALGGGLTIASGSDGAVLAITLPLGRDGAGPE